jgi:hypothetical protein
MSLRNLQGIGHVSTLGERIGTLFAFDRDGRFLGAFSNDRRIAIPAVLPPVHAKDCCFSTTAANSLIARTVEYSPNWETMMRPEKSKRTYFRQWPVAPARAVGPRRGLRRLSGNRCWLKGNRSSYRTAINGFTLLIPPPHWRLRPRLTQKGFSR